MMLKNVSIELYDNKDTCFRIIFNKSLAFDVCSLEWDYDDASKLHIRFEEAMGEPVGEVIDKAGEQEIITLVLMQMKKERYVNWDAWNFDEILRDRLEKL